MNDYIIIRYVPDLSKEWCLFNILGWDVAWYPWSLSLSLLDFDLQLGFWKWNKNISGKRNIQLDTNSLMDLFLFFIFSWVSVFLCVSIRSHLSITPILRFVSSARLQPTHCRDICFSIPRLINWVHFSLLLNCTFFWLNLWGVQLCVDIVALEVAP